MQKACELLREAAASGQTALVTMCAKATIAHAETILALAQHSQNAAAEADEEEEGAHEVSSSAPATATYRSLSADDDDEGEPRASDPAPAFRALSVDDDAEDMAAVGPFGRSLGAEDEEEMVERVPPCTSPLDEGEAVGRRVASFACSAEEELAQSLQALAVARVPAPLQRLHEEYRALYRDVFAA